MRVILDYNMSGVWCVRARACVCVCCVLFECMYVYNSRSCLHVHEFAKGRGMGTEKYV